MKNQLKKKRIESIDDWINLVYAEHPDMFIKNIKLGKYPEDIDAIYVIDRLLAMMYKFDLDFLNQNKYDKDHCIFRLYDYVTKKLYTISPLGHLYVKNLHQRHGHQINRKDIASHDNFIDLFKFLYKRIEKDRIKFYTHFDDRISVLNIILNELHNAETHIKYAWQELDKL